MKLTAIILTFNESMHIERCIASVRRVTEHVLVVDSYSTDDTVSLALSAGARVLQHAFTNHATQFNWALDQTDAETTWILRVDADEILDEDLVKAIRSTLPRTQACGLYVQRRMIFQGQDIRHGLVYPVNILRLVRRGHGHCVARWMDEHIQVDGMTEVLPGHLIDHNLHSLTWWIAKHNRYASLEAVEQLNLKYRFLPDHDGDMAHERLAFSIKRWAKHHVYGKLPPGMRAFAYFMFRYVVALGFLDGRAGTAFHFLQGFWYRYLVDAKVAEVERHMRGSGQDVRAAIAHILDVRLP